MPASHPAVFLDRDGTLIEDRGHVSSPEQVVFFPEAVPALKRLRGFRLFLVTNQSGVGQGMLRAEQVSAVNQFVVDQLRQQGIVIEAVYCCLHGREDGCACRKPNPYFAHQAARDHAIDLASSFMVGDHPCDVEFAANAGAHGIYVLTGHGAKHRGELSGPCDITEGIAQAVDRIVTLHAASVLRRGGLVAMPTETVYGLAGDAENEQAVRKIFAVKGRPANHPLIVHIADGAQLSDWTGSLSPAARLLAERFWPGPLTLILPKSERVSELVTGGQNTVGIRVPSHPLALGLLRELRGAVAAPSANRFGLVSPTTADHVRHDLGGEVDFVLDGGPCRVGIESTIVSLLQDRPEILRPGEVSQDELQSVLGCEVPLRAAAAIRVSGQLNSHYAPRAQVLLMPAEQMEEKQRELIAEGKRVEILSEADLQPAQLYASLRRADLRGADVVLVSLPDEQRLHAAVADRLRKAAAPRPFGVR